ncbi:hypothetical protein PV05_01914 [Exophiala xenobiotica]|uniref:Uncharacterized protein n=1 Tax=Exophiala xenobiotica TaxID=348802 RepID=A0A0D2FPB8_9EURO|nr:uncharacterized protein PV05_01914 [Exophiala xenobiotica]KIW61844.1 hypothetical protein PV05_01914 [Exophiala xenobiotica]
MVCFCRSMSTCSWYTLSLASPSYETCHDHHYVEVAQTGISQLYKCSSASYWMAGTVTQRRRFRTQWRWIWHSFDFKAQRDVRLKRETIPLTRHLEKIRVTEMASLYARR